MYFQIRRDAEKWYADIRSSFATDFDLYYLNVMAGFAARRKSEVQSGEAKDTVDYFVSHYKTKSNLIIALLISTELATAGINLEERDSVNRTIARLITPSAESHLTDEGTKLMNRYAHGGFEALLEYFNDRPRTIETFLRTYRNALSHLRANVTQSM